MDNNNINSNSLKQFWQEVVVQSMGNFYQRYNGGLERPILQWDAHVKTLNDQEDLQDLQETIHEYLTLFAIDVLRRQCTYTLGILVSNLKRWHLLTSSSSQGHIVFFLVELYQTLTKAAAASREEEGDLRLFFSDVELFLLNHSTRHWAALVDYAITHRKPGMLEKLRVFCEQHVLLFDIYVHIEAKYGVKLQDGMCAKKILGLLGALK